MLRAPVSASSGTGLRRVVSLALTGRETRTGTGDVSRKAAVTDLSFLRFLWQSSRAGSFRSCRRLGGTQGLCTDP